jgi:hypothetical protein
VGWPSFASSQFSLVAPQFLPLNLIETSLPIFGSSPLLDAGLI